jgi:hypothetical protein
MRADHTQNETDFAHLIRRFTIRHGTMSTSLLMRKLASSFPHEADLIQKLSSLETRVMTREPTTRPTCFGTIPGTGAYRRAANHGPGVPRATTRGKADASRSASRRSRARACCRASSAATAQYRGAESRRFRSVPRTFRGLLLSPGEFFFVLPFSQLKPVFGYCPCRKDLT